MLGTALRIIRNGRLTIRSYVIAGLGFVAVAVLGWPLVPVMLVLAPIAILATVLERRA